MSHNGYMHSLPQQGDFFVGMVIRVMQGHWPFRFAMCIILECLKKYLLSQYVTVVG